MAIKIGDKVSDGVPAPGAGLIARPFEHDVYRFTAAPRQTVYFRVWEISATLSKSYLGWRLADQDGTEVFKQGLFKLGLITDPKNDAQMRIWFNHGISHGIGLNVHDPGGRELQPGMVITVEPGLYFRPDALENLPKTPEMQKFAEAVRPVFEKYKGIGVRIGPEGGSRAGQPGLRTGEIDGAGLHLP